jgi:CheY-like chemotaxis protein
VKSDLVASAYIIRRELLTGDNPAILLTPRNRPTDALKGLKLGIVDYIAQGAPARQLLSGPANSLTEVPSAEEAIYGRY